MYRDTSHYNVSECSLFNSNLIPLERDSGGRQLVGRGHDVCQDWRRRLRDRTATNFRNVKRLGWKPDVVEA